MGLGKDCFVLIPHPSSATPVLCDLRQAAFPFWASKDYILIPPIFLDFLEAPAADQLCAKRNCLILVPVLSLFFKSSLRVWGSWPSPEGHFPVEQSPPGWGSNRNSCLLTGKCLVGPRGLPGALSMRAGLCPPRSLQTTVTLVLRGLSFLVGRRRGDTLDLLVFELWGALLHSMKCGGAVLVKAPSNLGFSARFCAGEQQRAAFYR